MIGFYTSLMTASAPLLRFMLKRRCQKGKEDPARLHERMGSPSLPRPEGTLIWFHAASVGEAQSTIILIETLHKHLPDAHFLVTSGTVTSAQVMKTRLPEYATHQYYPLDHPQWVTNFLDHWQPDLVLWMESEIWPNMLTSIQKRKIPAILINARLSEKSFKRWKLAPKQAKILLGSFNLFLAQTEVDAAFFTELGAENVQVGDNLKYSAAPLPYVERDIQQIKDVLGERPVWLYASTHDGEEDMACRIHITLKKTIPDILTIIVPRHPERRHNIKDTCEKYGLNTRLRTRALNLPEDDDDIYIADTLGELGLFYRLSPIACIGRSFSNDGGGGHNPIEAAQLGCAVIHGPQVQNLARIYEDMNSAGAILALKDEADFQERLTKLLSDEEGREALRNKAARFTQEKADILDNIVKSILPLLPAQEKAE